MPIFLPHAIIPRILTPYSQRMGRLRFGSGECTLTESVSPTDCEPRGESDMHKSDRYRAQLQAMPEWEPFLLRESGLPGPRSNLELAQLSR